MDDRSSMDSHTDKVELTKSKAHIILKIVEYVPNAVVCKTILKKSNGNITVTCFDTGEELAEKSSPYDNLCRSLMAQPN